MWLGCWKHLNKTRTKESSSKSMNLTIRLIIRLNRIVIWNTLTSDITFLSVCDNQQHTTIYCLHLFLTKISLICGIVLVETIQPVFQKLSYDNDNIHLFYSKCYICVTISLHLVVPNIYNHFQIFWDFLIFYQIFFSPQVKRSAIISNKHGRYELP